MKFLRVIAVAALAALGAAARADDVVVEERREPARSTAGVVAMDTIWGGVTGAVVSGGLIGYRIGVQDRENYEWGPVLATGIGIGLAAGLVWGIIDVASHKSYAARATPVTDGASYRETHRSDQSGVALVPIKFGTW
jgi:hypothetical protein